MDHYNLPAELDCCSGSSGLDDGSEGIVVIKSETTVILKLHHVLTDTACMMSPTKKACGSIYFIRYCFNFHSKSV